MAAPGVVTDAWSALERLLQNHKDVLSLEREIKRLSEARSIFLAEARELQEFVLKSGNEAAVAEMRSKLAFRNSTAPHKLPRPVEEKEIFGILRAFRALSLREADVVRLAQETYPGRPRQVHADALKKLLTTGEAAKNPDGTITFAIPFHLM